jgi:perosamine synthetase
VHTMPMYARSYRKHAVAEDLAWRGINLPSWPGLGQDGAERISLSVRGFFDHAH